MKVKLANNVYICDAKDSNFTNSYMKKLIILLCLFPAILWASKPTTIIQLNDEWQFTQTDKDEWHSATVPGSVQRDLIRLEILPDPYYGTNEEKVQWVENENWD